jgi:hypothetical protein
MEGPIKRIMQPAIADYRISSQILQGAIKRSQQQPEYNKYIKAARINYDLETLKEMSKPYLVKDLRKAWNVAIYDYTIYKKPSNKLKKAELYHELLNVNHDFAKMPKKQLKAPKRRQ